MKIIKIYFNISEMRYFNDTNNEEYVFESK